MGHALDNTMQDILIRFKRMQGYSALWQPGTDHAAIATEVKVTEKLKEQGIDKKEIGNRHSPTVIAAAITSRQDKNRLPTHISVRADRCGLAKDSIILTEQIRTLDKRRLRERAGVIPPDDMRRVDEALGVSMGLESQDVHTNTGYF